MVRKTKEDAAITRQRIICAAREVFLQKGVSRTSLEHIASHAGVTRGAVYWHFANKAELFYAMREEIYLPLIDRMDGVLLGNPDGSHIAPLERIRNHLQVTIQMLDQDQTMRETYEVMMTKCEYVDEFADVLKSILTNCNSLVHKLEQTYAKAQELGHVDTRLTAAELALDTHLFFSGLLHMWVKDTEGSLFRDRAAQLIDAHINLRKK
ncbi:transcriptional regulator, TetR family [Methylophilus rhizosphaerae]|uniref:Transcriptional regulator, TetR family n=1 Tax=Methylophilus rhizosphaerae TaxID=492660 RepID=A0A1G9F3W5_9PROT|nr:TetR family transcriptional regulator [Methylophilus rhizosphaerae]SDK83149.1 transcriptional regulator, TetR family [Methylophilus rhizosphaerae]